MKVIAAIIRPTNLDEINSALRKMGIERITVSRLVSRGRNKGEVLVQKGTDYVTDIMAKIKLEFVAADELVGRVIETIGRATKTERTGDCRIFIYSLVGNPIT